MMRKTLQTILILLFCVACSEPKQVHTQHNKNNGNTAIAQDWKILYQRSGGIMGLIQEATISNTGIRTLSNRDRTPKALPQLNSQQLTYLNELVTEFATVSAGKPGKKKRSGCRDCIESKATITYGSQQLQLSDNSSPKSQKLFRFLAEITPMR